MECRTSHEVPVELANLPNTVLVSVYATRNIQPKDEFLLDYGTLHNTVLSNDERVQDRISTRRMKLRRSTKLTGAHKCSINGGRNSRPSRNKKARKNGRSGRSEENEVAVLTSSQRTVTPNLGELIQTSRR